MRKTGKMDKDNLNLKLTNLITTAYKDFLVANYEGAIQKLKSAEVLDKNNPEILFNLGVNYSKLGLNKTSMKYFERIINLEQSFIDKLSIIRLYSYTLIKAKNFDEALKFLKYLLKLQHSDIVALNLLGYCYEKKAMFDDAERVFRAILSIDKKNLNAKNSLAYILALNKKKYSEALTLAKSLNEKDSGNPAYNDTIGFIYMKMGKYNEAKKFLLKANSISPYNSEIKLHLNELNQKNEIK